MATYAGRCQCGAVRFRLESEPITRGLRCNCSMCVRKGTIMSTIYFAPAQVTVEGRESLTLFQWGDEMVRFWFCRTCGIHVFHDTTGKPGALRLNLGCIEGLDVLALPLDWADGRSFPVGTP